jgi:hypothetical protein
MSIAPGSADETSHPAPHRERAPASQLLVALFLAPTAFAIQLMAAYVVASRMCSTGGSPQVPLLLIHAAAVLAAGIGFGFAQVLWRRTRNEKPGDAGEAIDRGEGRTRFLALCGLYGSIVFLIAVLVDASAVAFLGICPGLPVPS